MVATQMLVEAVALVSIRDEACHAIPARAFKGKGAQGRRNRVGDPRKSGRAVVNRLPGLDHGRIYGQAGAARART